MQKTLYTIRTIICAFCVTIISCQPKSDMPLPTPSLGLTYTPTISTFSIWAPEANAVQLKFYQQGVGGEAVAVHQLEKYSDSGVWAISIEEDLKGLFYVYQVQHQGEWLRETPGIYAKAVGVNGLRAAVVDFEETNPKDWNHDVKPRLKHFTDIVLYELHVRDISVHPSSGVSEEHKGKFLGLVENGTINPDGLSTTIDHMKDLGITHVHLLPSYDFYTVDESKPEVPQFNWGYDPMNYNVPEGSYSTNANDPTVRIREFKEMVQAFHKNGIRVVMDVVYNHTMGLEEAQFNAEYPGYYYRQWEDGAYSDASACGNETASDQPKMREYITNSVMWWAEEYHIDGFRFDLMGIHDVETMNSLTAKLQELDPSIYVYGEGWTAGDSPLPDSLRTTKANMPKAPLVAAFSDDIRDGIKGHYADEKGKGFVQGAECLKETIMFGVVGATQHPQIDYEKVNYSNAPWAIEPYNCINYVSCHDNQTLYDKLRASAEEASEDEILKMDKLANTIVLTSQGVPFLHAGVEIARTKGGEHNSYNKPDSVNSINWNWKTQHLDLFEYYQNVIAIREKYSSFRFKSNKLIQKHIQFLDTPTDYVVAYTITETPQCYPLFVAFNGGESTKISIPDGTWKVLVYDSHANVEGIKEIEGGNLHFPATSAIVLEKLKK